MICVSIAESDFETCVNRIKEEQLAEVRLDAGDFTAEQVKVIFSQSIPLIATCRDVPFLHEKRQSIIEQAITSGASYVDIEIESDPAYREALVKTARDNNCTIIISYHNFKETPSAEELAGIVLKAKKYGADIVKIACMVNSAEDNYTLLQLYPAEFLLVAIGMGDKGMISRIMAPVLGAPFTFASPDKGIPTAPGQISKTAMKNLIQHIINNTSTKS